MQYAWILIVTSIVGGEEYSSGMTTRVSGGDPIVSVARFHTQGACLEVARQIGGDAFIHQGIGHNVSAECVLVTD